MSGMRTYGMRTLVCRGVFFCAALLPTLAVAAWSTWRATSDASQYYADQIAYQLGGHVAIDDVEYLAPGSYRLIGMRLCDAENDGPLLETTAVTIDFAPTLDHRDATFTSVTLESATLHHERIGELWLMLHPRMLRQRDFPPRPIELTCPELELVGRDGTQRLHNVRFYMQQLEQGPQLRVEFHLANGQLGSAVYPITIEISRVASSTSPVTRVVLHTHGQPFPCHLLTGDLAWISRLGDLVQFEGTANMYHEHEGWSGSLNGTFSGLDLDRLAHPNQQPSISGPATCQVRSANWSRGVLNYLNATVSAGPGIVATDTIHHAVDRWNCRLLPDADVPGSQVRYEELRAEVHLLRDEKLRIYGVCEEHPETVLRTLHGPLLRQPAAPLSDIRMSLPAAARAILAELP
ncbi:MAG: hypothetical protein R3E01_23370 [Pirellulaceae bacterium]